MTAFITVLGFVGAACFALCTAPQILRVLKRKSTADISLLFILYMPKAIFVYFKIVALDKIIQRGQIAFFRSLYLSLFLVQERIPPVCL
jgi:uncharacterized protein with PQ loop repeat